MEAAREAGNETIGVVFLSGPGKSRHGIEGVRTEQKDMCAIV